MSYLPVIFRKGHVPAVFNEYFFVSFDPFEAAMFTLHIITRGIRCFDFVEIVLWHVPRRKVVTTTVSRNWSQLGPSFASGK